MSYKHLLALEGKMELELYSTRSAAKAIGMSYSALARILREDTYRVSPHIDLRIQRWLYPERELPPCPCSRCQGQDTSLEERINTLEDMLARHREWMSALEESMHMLTTALTDHEHPVRLPVRY